LRADHTPLLRVEKVRLGLEGGRAYNATVELGMKSKITKKVKLKVTEDDLIWKNAQGGKG
jgi:hypothetical protein